MSLILPDLSEWQPNADMGGIKRVNDGAVIVRLAYGTSHPDHPGARMRRDAAAAGFQFTGLYQYIVAGQDIRQQAEVFCGLIGHLAPHEIPVADLEEGAGNQSGRFAQWARVISSRTGKRPWLYSGESFANSAGLAPLFNGTAFHTWVAAYGDTEPSLGHTLWQSTDGTAGAHRTDWPGAGFCDTSLYHGDLAQLAALVTPPAPAPAPQPAPAAVTDYTATGAESLAAIAIAHQTGVSTVLRRTAVHQGAYSQAMAAWLDAVFAGTAAPTSPVPRGCILRVAG